MLSCQISYCTRHMPARPTFVNGLNKIPEQSICSTCSARCLTAYAPENRCQPFSPRNFPWNIEGRAKPIAHDRYSAIEGSNGRENSFNFSRYRRSFRRCSLVYNDIILFVNSLGRKKVPILSCTAMREAEHRLAKGFLFREEKRFDETRRR